MMRKITFIISIILTTLVINAQEIDSLYGDKGLVEGVQYVVTRHDDVEYIGEILKDDGREVLIKTKNLGIVYIPKSDIKSIYEIKDQTSIKFNEYQPEGPFTTRYAFTTNALPIKKGENYGMLNVYGPEVHFALSNKLNMGIMTTWMASPLVVAIKYSFNEDVKDVNFSFGSLIGTSSYINGFDGFGGLHWLNVTIGDRKNNITFSGGFAYLQTGNDSNEPAAGVYYGDAYYLARENVTDLQKMINGPIVSVAGFFKIGGKASFIFDSMIGYFNHEMAESTSTYIDDETIYTVTRDNNAFSTALFIMPGVRFQKTDSRAFQICVAGVSTFGATDISFPIPMLSLFYKF